MTVNDRYRRSHGNARDAAQNEPNIDFETTERRCESFDDMFSVLKDRYRRYALYYLADRSTADLDALIDYVAGRETARSERFDRGEMTRKLRIEFHHKHLPMLEDAGLVEYDERNGTLVYRGRWPAFERLLRTTRRNDPVLRG